MTLPNQKDSIVNMKSDGNGRAFIADPAQLSTADYSGLQKSFPASPIYQRIITDKSLREEFVELALRGPVKNKSHIDINTSKMIYKDSPGYEFSSFNRDYAKNGAPSYKEVNAELLVNWDNEEYRAGDPGNAFIPNLISVPQADIGGYGKLPKNGRPPVSVREMIPPGGVTFVGVGIALDPKNASKRLTKRPGLIMGKSSIESIGAMSTADITG